MEKRRSNVIFLKRSNKRMDDLADGLLLSTVALIGFVLLWSTIWSLTDGSVWLGAWLPFDFSVSVPTQVPAGLFRGI